MYFRPIFKTGDGADISKMEYALGHGVLYPVSDHGDVYRILELEDNAFGHGDRRVYTQILDGIGNRMDGPITDFTFELYRAIVSVEQDQQDFTIVAESVDAWSAERKTVVTGVYISDILAAGEDFGYWNTISWTQSCLDSRVVVAIKTGFSVAEVEAKDWERYFEEPCVPYYGGSGSTLVTRNLDFFNLRGNYIQFKVELITELDGVVPQVRDLVISYVGKHSVFFFTDKIRIERGSEFGNAIITASVTLPSRTEVAFAFGPADSVEWSDYKVVDAGRLAQIPAAYRDRMRVGIRFTSYDAVSVATVHEFAFSFDSDDENKINEQFQ